MIAYTIALKFGLMLIVFAAKTKKVHELKY